MHFDENGCHKSFFLNKNPISRFTGFPSSGHQGADNTFADLDSQTLYSITLSYPASAHSAQFYQTTSKIIQFKQGYAHNIHK